MISPKLRFLALRIFSKTQRTKHGGTGWYDAVSFEDLDMPFQDARIMELREKGLLSLSSTNEGKPGVLLKRFVADMTIAEFQEYLKQINVKHDVKGIQ